MDIKQLSEVAGVSGETIRRTAKTLFPDIFRRGVKTVFTKDQCFDIIQKVPKKNMVQMNDTQPVQQPTQSVEVIAQAVAIAMQSVMLPMMEKMLSNQKALPEPIKQDYYSLTAYCILKKFKLNFSEAVLHGKQLTKLCKSKGIEKRKIKDERYGFVGSYPVEILEEHFSV